MIFFKLLSHSFRSQLQYKASFIMNGVGQFISAMIEITAIWALFERFTEVKGWTLDQVALIYGLAHMGFATAEIFGRGFERFSQLIRHGDFDGILLRPISPFLQIAASQIQPFRLGRLLQGTLIFCWGLLYADLSLSPFTSLIFFLSLIGTICLFYGLFVIQATIAFWTVESLELLHMATYGGLQTGQYPMTLYTKPFRWIFTLLIPIACVIYYPVATLLGHETLPSFICAIIPLSGILFLIIAAQFWRLGIRHYRSTGS